MNLIRELSYNQQLYFRLLKNRMYILKKNGKLETIIGNNYDLGDHVYLEDNNLETTQVREIQKQILK